MEDELQALLETADALGALDGLNDDFEWPVDVLEVKEEAISSSDSLETPRSQRDANIERKRQYRRRKKAEAEDLRAQHKKLEAQLEALRIQMKAGKSPATLGWKAIAQRQWKQRLEASALNRELKTHVRLYHEVALKLTEMLPTQMSQQPMSIMPSAAVLSEVELNASDIEMMHRLARESEEMYAEADGLIADSYPVQLPAGSTYAAHKSWKSDGVLEKGVLDLSEVIALPFELADIISALKRALLKSYCRECNPALMEVPEDDTTVVAKVHFSSSTCEVATVPSKTVYESAFASRVFIEEDRTVFTSKTVMRELGSPGNWQSAVHIAFSSWGVGISNGEGGTALRFYSRLQLFNYISPENGGGQVDELHRLYLERYAQLAEEDASDLLWSIENEIMDSKGLSGN